MLTWQLETGPFRITLWEEAAKVGWPSQDASLVQERDGALRVAVLDGVSPHRTRSRAGVDDAVWASAVTRAALAAPVPLGEALRSASDHLHEGLPEARAEAQACTVAADITARGIQVVRAGDCEAWVQRAGLWGPLLVGDHLTTEGRRRVTDWERSHPEAGLDELLAAESRLLAHPHLWRTTPVGRLRVPVLQQLVHSSDWHALCLTSDGACLTRAALRDVPAWMSRVRDHEREHRGAHAKPRDDITVLLIERSF